MGKITKTMQPKHKETLSPWLKQYIDTAANSPLPMLRKELERFPQRWTFPRGDLYHWIPLLNRFDNILEAVVDTYDLKDTMQSRDFGCTILLGKGKGVSVDYHGNPQEWDMAKLQPLGYSQDGDRQLLVAVLSFTEMLLTCCGNRSIYLSSGHLDHLLNSTYNDVVITALKVGQQLAERYSASVKRLSSGPTRQLSLGLLRNHYNIELDKVNTLATPFVKTPLAKSSDPAPVTPASASKAKEKAHFGGPKNLAPKYANDLKYIIAPESDSSHWDGWGDIKVSYYPKSAAKTEALERAGDHAPADRAGPSSVPATPTPLRRSSTMPTAQTPRVARPAGTSDDSSPIQPRTPAPAGHEETPSASLRALEVPQSAVMSQSIYELLARCPHDMPLDKRYEYLHRLRVAKALLGSPKDRQDVLAMRLLAVNNLAFIYPETTFLDSVLIHDDEEPRRTQLVYQLAELIHPAGDGESEVPLSLQTLSFNLLEIISHFPSRHNDVLSALNANVNHGVLLYVVRKAVERMAQSAVEEDRQKQEDQDRWTFALLQLAFQLGLEARLAPEIMSAGLMDSLIEILKLRTATALRFHASVFTFLDQLVANIHGHFNQATITPGSLEAVADLLHFTVTKAQELVAAGQGNPSEMRTTIVDYDVPFYQQQTLKWGLKFIHRIMSHFSFGANTDRVLRNMVDNSALLRSLRSVIEGKQMFGSVVWTNTVTLLSDFLNHDPTSFAAIQESGMIKGFLEALTGREVTIEVPAERPPPPQTQSQRIGGSEETRNNEDDGDDDDNENEDGDEPSSPAASEASPDLYDDVRPHPPTQAMLEAPREVPIARGILPSGEAISIVPSILNSICLNNVGMKMVVQSRVLDTLMEVFESPEHVRLVDSSDGDCFHGLGASLDELARHHPNLRQHVGNAIVDMLARVVHLACHKESAVAAGARLLVKDSQGKTAAAADGLLTTSKGKEKAISGGQDVEMVDASTANVGTSTVSSTPTPNSSLPEGSILPHLLALQIFFEGAIQQNNHIKSTIYKAGGIELLLQLMEAPSLPASQIDDSRGLKGLIMITSSFIAEKPIIGVPSLLHRLQKAIDTLESLATDSGPRPSFGPFLRDDGGVHDAEQLATGTRLVKAILHAQLLMRTLSHCFPQSRQSVLTFPNVNVYDYYARFIKALSPLLHSFQKEEMALPGVVPGSWLQWWRTKSAGNSQTKNQVFDVLYDPRQRVTGQHSEPAEPVATTAAESSAPAATLTIEGGETGSSVMKFETGDSFAYTAHNKDSKPSAEEQKSPQFLNFKSLMGLLNGFQLSAFSLVLNIGKALFARSKDRDAYTRYRQMQLAELIAEVMVRTVEVKGDANPMDYASCIIIIQNVQELLLSQGRYNDRQSPLVVLPVLIAFKEKGGLDMLNTMVQHFADVMLQEKDTATENHEFRRNKQLAALGMGKVLEIYSVLVKGRNITESNALVSLLPPRQGLRTDDRRPEIGQIGSQILVEIRMSIFPVVRTLWDSQFLEKSSGPVLEKLLDVLKTILTGEQETAAYRRSNTTAPSVNFKAEPAAFGWSNISATDLSRVDDDSELAKEAMYRTNGRQDDAISYCVYHKKGLAGERNPIPEEDTYRETPTEPKSRALGQPSPSRVSSGTGAGRAADAWRAEPPDLSYLIADMTRASDDSPASDDSQASRPTQTQATPGLHRPPTSTLFGGTPRTTEQEATPSSATPIPVISDNDRPKVTKDDLDEARAEFRKNAVDRCLEVLQAHPESVFEVAELIQHGILRPETEDQRREIGEILANALMSFASEDDKSSVGRSIAAYAHLLSLLLQDKAFYKVTLPALKENVGAYLGFLKPVGASSATGTGTGDGAQAASTPWIAYILLIFESLLADDETPVEVKWRVPTKEDETIEEPVLQEREPNLQPEEKAELLNDVLGLLPHIGKDEALAVSALRILVIMTRDRAIAKEVGSKKQLQRLFVMTKQLCGAESARLKDSRVTKTLMIILRHIIEDEDTVRQIMRTEIKTFVENAARNPRTPDLNSYLRHLGHVALRNPKLFIEVTAEMVKFSRWTPSSSEISSRQQPQPLLVLKESARSSPSSATSTQKTDDVSVEPAVQGTEDLTISDVKPSTETGADKVMADVPKTPAVETKPPVLENPDGVVHFILSELLNYREVEDKEVPPTAVPNNDKDKDKDVKSSGASETAPTAVTTPEASTDKEKKSATPKFLPEEHPIFVYRCFLLNCLTELLQSYTRAKVEFINFKRNAPIQAATPVKPRSSVLNYLIHDLLSQNNMLLTPDSIPLKKKAATSAAAQQVLVALVTKTGEKPVDRQVRALEYDDEADLLFVRRFVLDTILKAYKGTCTSSEPFDVRYAKMLSLAELMTQMIGGGDKSLTNPRGTDPIVSQTQAQLKRLMFEKGYLSALTASISELDLSFPDVKRTIKYILRVVKSLAKIAIALSHANLITEAQVEAVEDEIASASSLSDMDDEDDDREETPDLYRNSTLGMLEPGGDDEDYSEDEDENDEMDYEEYGDEMDYDEDFSEDNEEDVSEDDEDEMGPIEGLPGDIPGDIEVVMDDMDDIEGEDMDEDDEDMDEDDEEDDDEEDDEDDDDDDEEMGSQDMEELEDQVQIMDEEGNPVDDDGQSGWEDETDEEDDGDEDEEEIDYDAEIDGFGAPGHENGLPGRLGHIMGALGLPVPGGDRDDDDMAFDPYGEDGEDDEDEAEDDDMDDDDLYYGGRDALDDFNFHHTHGSLFDMPAGLGWDVVPEGGAHHRHRHGELFGRSLSRHLGPPAGQQDDGLNPLLRRDPASAHARSWSPRPSPHGPSLPHVVRLGFPGGMPPGGADSLAMINDIVANMPMWPGRTPNQPFQVQVSSGPDGVVHEITIPPGPPQVLPASQPFGHSHRHSSRDSASVDPQQAVAFTPVITVERWQEEARMVFGHGYHERASSRLMTAIQSKLVPPALQHEKEVKAREAEAKQKRDEERKKREEEERKAREAREAEEKAGREKKEAEERERAEREAAEAAAAQAELDAEAAQNNKSAEQEAGQNVPEAMEGVETTANDATASGATGNASATRVTTTIRGETIDVTELGIDPDYLAALPEEYREEVIAHTVSSRRLEAREAEREASGAGENTEVYQEFLDALPDDLRAEIVQQERHERRRRDRDEQRRQAATNNADVAAQDMDDPASILLTFPRDLRQQVLMDQGDDIMDQLPPDLAAEAREIAAQRHGSLPQRQTGGMTRLQFDGARPTRQAPPGGVTTETKPQRRAVVQMLDKQGIATLLRLIFISQPETLKKSLQDIFAAVCENRLNRLEVISTLLLILQDGSTDMEAVERSFGQLSLKAKSPKDKDTVSKTPGSIKRTLTNIGVSPPSQGGAEISPLLVVQQCLDLLTVLSYNPHVPSLFLTEHDIFALQLKRGLNRKGKGKEVANTKAQKYAINYLLGLLDRDLVMESSNAMQTLASLLNKVTYPLQAFERRRRELEEEAKKKEQADREKADKEKEKAETGTEKMEIEAEGATSGNQPSTEAETQAEDKDKAEEGSTAKGTKPAEEKKVRQLTPPTIPEANLKLVTNIFVARECSSKTFQNTISTIKNLSYIPGAKRVFGEELVRQARVLSENIVSDLDELLPHILKAESGTQIQGVALAKFSPGASEQNKLLRVLTALDHLFDKKNKKSETPDEEDTEKGDLLGSLYWNATFGTMWDKLSACLAAIRERENMLSVATILLPLIESLMVVCKNTTINDAPLSASLTGKEMLLSSPPPENRIAGLFFTFTEEHRRILNELVRSNPKLMSGTFSLLVKNPKVLEFDNKRNYFNRSVHHKTPNQAQRPSYPTLQLQVRRDHVFHDSFKSLYFKSGDEMKFGKLSIKFHGEEGVDAGGVTREWFQALSRQMFNPNYALFVPVSSDRTTFHPNTLSGINEEHLQFFKFIGRIIGKALYEGRVLDCYFSRAVYKRILGKPVSVKDMESFDPDYYKSLTWMLENDITDIITETFSVEEDHFGVATIKDLCENGRNIPVTEENKHEYVRLVVEHKLLSSVSEQMQEFLKGFHDIIPPELISIFNEQELELLISGLPDIDVDDWKAHTEYHSYNASSPQIQWFWRAVRSFDLEERAKLLQFVTGTSKVPLNGFKELEGMNGVARFNIHRDYGKTDRLPSSHTCFNQLDLPEYESYDILRSRLLKAITAGSDYFGFA
ncbi:hypothetical protein DL546_007100 [Coniochaeta pulveracea]|uniref:HECT-type E3 ubiquitin transferase n=1 Tax=Coniochaeta pulveracea TaxID=177199 RepID=A0A420YGI1_9PEZI|nr:hypothetical protein DL546_007100 [Coniochaeta pulveracea]